MTQQFFMFDAMIATRYKPFIVGFQLCLKDMDLIDLLHILCQQGETILGCQQKLKRQKLYGQYTILILPNQHYHL